MKKNLKEYALAALLIGLTLSGATQAKELIDNVEYESMNVTSVGSMLKPLVKITFPADKASYSVPVVRVKPSGIATKDDFYATFHLLDANGKSVAQADNDNSFDYLLTPGKTLIKGNSVTYTLAVSINYYPDDDEDNEDGDDKSFSFQVWSGEFSGPRGFQLQNNYFYTEDMVYDNNWKQADVWFNPADSIKDFTAAPGVLVNLLAIRADVYTSEREGAIVPAPSFQFTTADNKTSDLLRLQLEKEGGAVISAKPKVSSRGDYLLVEFPGATLSLSEGITTFFVKGKANASLKETNIAGALVMKDSALPLTPQGQLVDSGENHERIVGHTVSVSAKK